MITLIKSLIGQSIGSVGPNDRHATIRRSRAIEIYNDLINNNNFTNESNFMQFWRRISSENFNKQVEYCSKLYKPNLFRKKQSNHKGGLILYKWYTQKINICTIFVNFMSIGHKLSFFFLTVVFNMMSVVPPGGHVVGLKKDHRLSKDDHLA